MFGFQSLRIDPEKLLSLLEDCEGFCRGEKHLSPEQFKELNEELSLGAMVYVGKCYCAKKEGDRHLIWIDPEGRQHDLGPADRINIMKDCPGFHRLRSLALGQAQVESSACVDMPALKHQISVVKMKDGSTGIGPNYKIALRNAALKMHLKKQFAKANPLNLWKSFYGNA